MKQILLLIAFLASFGASAQTTHMVDWFMGVPSSETNITIEQGDTVTWTWEDAMPHTVTSTGGTATFNSGTKTGIGQNFSHTFNAEGATTYHCNIHPSMQGTITVQAVMGVNDNIVSSLKYYPNPVKDVFTITAATNIDRVEVYDMNGRLLMSSEVPNPTIKVYMENFNTGTYFVKATIDKEIKNIAVVKQ